MDCASLASIIECPVCYDTPRDRIFLCIAGHSICEDCYNKLDDNVCQTARCNYADPPGRSYKEEEILRKADLELPCKYNRDGCCQKLKRADRKNHEEKCPHRSQRCQFFQCQDPWQSVRDLPDHYCDVHDAIPMLPDNGSLSAFTIEETFSGFGAYRRNREIAHILSLENNVFLLHTIYKGNHFTMALIHLIPDPTCPRNYTWQVDVRHGDPRVKKTELTYQGPVLESGTNKEDIIRFNLGFECSKDTLYTYRYKTQDGNCSLKFRIETIDSDS